MKPFLHSKGSVARWGGVASDYDAINDFLDSSKMCMPDMRHRAALHNAFGCYLVEKVFGRTIINSDGKEVSTRDVAEAHIIEDLGFLPSLEDFLDELPLSKWHGGIHRLPKNERPPTPAEERAAQRTRIEDAVYWGIRSGALQCGQDDCDEEQEKMYDEAITKIIHAIKGVEVEEEE